jgi:hypothetical protein
LRQTGAEARNDRLDLLLQRLVPHQLAALELRHHLGGEVVGGGAEAAAGPHHVKAPLCHVVQRGEQVLAAVADDSDLREVAPQLFQAVGQGAVAIGHAAAQHLGAASATPSIAVTLTVPVGCARRARLG